jgi:hypothetical protein
MKLSLLQFAIVQWQTMGEDWPKRVPLVFDRKSGKIYAANPKSKLLREELQERVEKLLNVPSAEQLTGKITGFLNEPSVAERTLVVTFNGVNVHAQDRDFVWIN